jgi:hypothetical protein
MGGIKKKNNTLSGVFLGFRLTDLPASFFAEKAGRRFMGMKGGVLFLLRKNGLPQMHSFCSSQPRSG